MIHKIGFLLIALLFTSLHLDAQTDKYTDKLKGWYDDKNYEKIIEYKSKKESKMAAQSLYYKGLAHYLSDNDDDAQRLLRLAIEKGPATSRMHYYLGKSLAYQKKYRKALKYFDQAIALPPEKAFVYEAKAKAYVKLNLLDSALLTYEKALSLDALNSSILWGIASTHFDSKNYPEAAKYYSSALEVLEENTEDYKVCEANIGLSYLLGGEYEKSKASISSHLKTYPKDYGSISRLIQAHYALGEEEETADLHQKMLIGYEAGKLEKYQSKMYCVSFFDWNEKRVKAYTNYRKYAKHALPWGHQFDISDQKGNVYFQVKTLLDTNTAPDEALRFYLYKLKDDTLYKYNHFVVYDNTDYLPLQKAVIDILNDSVQPVNIQTHFTAFLLKKQRRLYGSQGLSMEEAIVVNSIKEEYQWLREHYSGYQFQMQALLSEGGKYYDRLTIKTTDGAVLEFYFDISNFFGKGF